MDSPGITWSADWWQRLFAPTLTLEPQTQWTTLTGTHRTTKPAIFVGCPRLTTLKNTISKGEKTMTLLEYYGRKIPDYYDTMYQDGYSPYEIMAAAEKSIIERAKARKQQSETYNVNIKSEMKVKK